MQSKTLSKSSRDGIQPPEKFRTLASQLARDTYVKTSTIPGAGLGLFAKTNLQADQTLGRQQGVSLSAKEYRTLYPKRDAQQVMKIGTQQVDAADPTKSNVLRQINAPPSSRRPNVWIGPRGILRIGDTAVKANEELFMDYGESFHI